MTQPLFLTHDLKTLEPLLVELLRTPNAATNQVIEHVFSAGGKRLRPSLFLQMCALGDYRGEHKFSIACVCEYIHTASLMHDDVIDNSSLRRGKPTSNSIWGDQTAVLAGDLIYSAACRLMVKTKHLELIDTFAECIRFMSESELFQLDLLWKSDVTLAQYSRLVHGKTAALFAASCKTALFLFSQHSEAIQAAEAFGHHLGVAFQAVDDALDYSQTEATVGKPVASDIIQGKITLPVLMAMEHQQSHSKLLPLIQELFTTGEAGPDLQTQLKEQVISLGGLDKSLLYAKQHIDKALENLETLVRIYPHTECETYLRKLAISSLERTH
jgi:octaprenyl-diphosphate synthase